MNVVISSWWRNDAARNLDARAAHLLAKTGASRWVWVVGDSLDHTETRLREIAMDSGKDVTIIRHDTQIGGTDPDSRLLRLGQTGNAAFDTVRDSDDLWLHHESDLQSPVDLVQQFIQADKDVIAGWVTLADRFYDTWGYTANGELFRNDEPFHAVYRPDAPFEVDTVGSVIMFPASELRAGCRFRTRGVRDLCWQMKAHGLHVWCDPRIKIVQPEALWTPQAMPQ